MTSYCLPASVATELRFLAMVIESDILNDTLWGTAR